MKSGVPKELRFLQEERILRNNSANALCAIFDNNRAHILQLGLLFPSINRATLQIKCAIENRSIMR